MPNYNPKTEHLPPYPRIHKDKPSKKTISVRVLEEEYENYMGIPKELRSELLREFIRDMGNKFNSNKVKSA